MSPSPSARAARTPRPHDHLASVDSEEVARFEALAEEWWDPKGKFRPLHRLNPVRLAFIRDQACAHFSRDPRRPRPFAGLTVLDIGCGGGLAAEPMARLGAAVTAIDPAARNVEVARRHAERTGLAIDYRHAGAEDLVAKGAMFDVVLALEIVEHVADLGAFLGAAADLVKPNGALVVATLNRTPQAFLLAIVGAEYVLGWLPRGTHDWRKFVRPSELARHLRHNGVTVEKLTGVVYSPFADVWQLSSDLAVNYMAFGVKR